MSRIRSIHPGIFTDEAFMTASPHARILVMGLWCEALDDGVFEWKPLTLKVRLMPADAVEIEPLLDELERLNFVRRFQAKGKAFGVIRNFQKFQRPKKPRHSGLLPNELAPYARGDGPADEPEGEEFGTGGEPVPPGEEDGGGGGIGGKEEAEARASAREAAPPSRPTITDTAQFAAWIRTLVGQEPVLIAQDTHALARLLDEGCTLADVEAGIAAAMDKRDFRPRQWSQLVGWVRGAAKDRLEAEAKAAPTTRTVAKPPVDPELDRRNRLAKATAHFRDEWRQGWPEDMRPGHPSCTTAADVIEEARLAVERERAVYANGLPARRDGSGRVAA